MLFFSVMIVMDVMPTDLQWSVLWIVSRVVGLNEVFVLSL